MVVCYAQILLNDANVSAQGAIQDRNRYFGTSGQYVWKTKLNRAVFARSATKKFGWDQLYR